jgi:hypothetical protein
VIPPATAARTVLWPILATSFWPMPLLGTWPMLMVIPTWARARTRPMSVSLSPAWAPRGSRTWPIRPIHAGIRARNCHWARSQSTSRVQNGAAAADAHMQLAEAAGAAVGAAELQWGRVIPIWPSITWPW